MKDEFGEYYRLTDAEIIEHWQKDIISFDANVLLNLYRYTPSTRDAFFDLLDKIKDRIWISYQAAYEYQKNRLTVISAQKEAYEEIRDTLLKKEREIEAKLNGFKKHPYLQAAELKKQINSAFQSIRRDLDQAEEKHPNYLAKDPIFERLTVLLDKRVGKDFDQEELEKTYKVGKKRYEEKVPPGYMDLKSKSHLGNRSIYGDLIVWKQVMAQASLQSNSVIFVTDDLKEDWWYRFKGDTIGARPELLKEFRDVTHENVSIYQADKFLEYANTNLKQNTTQDAIDEIRHVREFDELEIREILDKAEKLIESISDTKFRGAVSKGFEGAIDSHIHDLDEDNVDER